LDGYTYKHRHTYEYADGDEYPYSSTPHKNLHSKTTDGDLYTVENPNTE
jgi:hypothetical protein